MIAQLSWQVEPEPPRSGAAVGALAWCACGWREFNRFTRSLQHAEDALRLHREQFCPWRKDDS